MKTVEDGVMLPESELAVMMGIWEAYNDLARPVTTREVVDHAPELRKWKTVTVLTFIDRLYGRGFIQIEKIEGRQQKLYTPRVSRAEYQAQVYQEFVKNTMLGDRMELARLLIGDMFPDEVRAAANIPGIFPER